MTLTRCVAAVPAGHTEGDGREMFRAVCVEEAERALSISSLESFDKRQES